LDRAVGKGGAEREGNTMTTLIKLIKDESGASAAEYALILAIVGSVIAIAAIALGNSISKAMSNTGKCVESRGAANYSTNC
jgi:pilus assembly protein Flp/PilA